VNPIRLAQIASRIQERIANVLAYEMKDPRSRFVTVTGVKVAKDLSVATVSYSVLGDETDRSLVSHMLEHASGFLEREVRKVVHARTSPRLVFRFDESIEGAIELSQKIDEIIAQDRAAQERRREQEGEPSTDSSDPSTKS
jgi:ribosome-binding factor A